MTIGVESAKIGRTFSFGELYGPFDCEVMENGKVCGAETYSIELTAEESIRLNSGVGGDKTVDASGNEAAAYIITRKLGKAVCPKHHNSNHFPSIRSWIGPGKLVVGDNPNWSDD